MSGINVYFGQTVTTLLFQHFRLQMILKFGANAYRNNYKQRLNTSDIMKSYLSDYAKGPFCQTQGHVNYTLQIRFIL